jgi:hypothetical protein
MAFLNRNKSSESKKQKYNVKKTSKIVIDDVLWEQVRLDTGECGYIGWESKKQKLHGFRKSVSDKSKQLSYVPLNDGSVESDSILLPSDALDYGDEEILEEEIKEFISKWLDVSDEYREKAAWYVMLTWVTDNLNTVPYLRPIGDYGTGKTRFEDTVGGLCYKAMFFGGAANVAPMYRMMNLWKGTLVLDEFNLDRSDAKSDIIQILNNGYQRGKPIHRCNPNDVTKVDTFDPFGPKIMVTRIRFHDKALESRCLTEQMKETIRDDIPTDLTKEFFEERDILRNKLLMFRFRNWDKVDIEKSMSIDFGDIMPRVKQTFLPFTVLFSNDEERLNGFVKYVQEYNKRIVEENASSFDGQLINAYVDLLNDGAINITVQDILDRTIQNGGCNSTTNVRTVGRHLKVLGFDEPIIRKVDKKTVRVVNVSQNTLERLKKKYVVR